MSQVYYRVRSAQNGSFLPHVELREESLGWPWVPPKIWAFLGLLDQIVGTMCLIQPFPQGTFWVGLVTPKMLVLQAKGLVKSTQVETQTLPPL